MNENTRNLMESLIAWNSADGGYRNRMNNEILNQHPPAEFC